MSDTTKKSESGKGSIIAAIIGAAATLGAALIGNLAGWIHFGPEADDLRFPIAVFDNSTKGAIPDADVSLEIPDLSPGRTDSGGKITFKLTKRLLNKQTHLIVSKGGYTPSSEQILSLQPQDEFHKVYLIPIVAVAAAPPAPEITRVYPSGQKASGSRKAFSDWYRICSGEAPEAGYRVGRVAFNLSGDRVCNAWSECRQESISASQVCWQFRLQGHDEWPPPGQALSEGLLTVVWVKP